MEDDYKTSRRNKERDKGIRRGADDDYYYRDTEDTLAYRERKHEREYYHDEEDFSEDEKTRRSPEKSSRHRERREQREKKESSRKEKRESPDKRRKKHRESHDPHNTSHKERSVHYKEEKRHSKHSKDDRGRSKERARRKSRREKCTHEDADQNEENEEASEDEKKKSAKHTRKSSRKISDVSDNEFSDGSPLPEVKLDNHIKERLASENNPPQDSLEKVRCERSKDTTRRKKSRDTSRKRNGSEDEGTRRRKKSKSRSKYKRHTDVANLSLAISETYEEMKKSSQSSWDVKANATTKKKDKKKSEETYENSKTELREKSREKRKRTKLKSEKSDHKEKKDVNSKKHESKIRKELRKKQEPRLCHSDSEIDMGKSRKSTRNLSDDAQETSSNASEDKQLDIDSLYDLYKDPDPNSKPPVKEVVIREPHNKDNTEPPKKISIDQTDIRSKLIRVLFQRVKELLKETEILRNERKTLCQTIEALSDDLEELRTKEVQKAAKEAKIEERLAVLADEMKITPTGNSFREEIHHILHDIQAKYQTHWKEHESKIQQVQNDAEFNIQNLMKNIVGKYLEFSELNDPTKTAQDMAKFTAELREKLNFNEDKMKMNDKDKYFNMIKKQTLDKKNSDEIKKINSIDKRINREKEIADFRQSQQKQNMALASRKEEALIETLHRERQRMLQQADANKDLQSSFERKETNNPLNKANNTRLNEPLFINTHAYENNDGIYNEIKGVKDNKDLLLQIAKPAANKNSDTFYHFNQRPAQYYIPDGKESSTKSIQSQNDIRQNTERLMPDRSTQESIARSQQIYEETKNSFRQSNNHHPIDDIPQQAPILGKYPPALSDIPSSRYSQQYDDEEFKKLANLKMDTKEFWRHKLLQPSSNDINFSEREPQASQATTVRNTY